MKKIILSVVLVLSTQAFAKQYSVRQGNAQDQSDRQGAAQVQYGQNDQQSQQYGQQKSQSKKKQLLQACFAYCASFTDPGYERKACLAECEDKYEN